MSKEDCIEVTGTVVEKFPSGLFNVELDQERVVLAHLAGKLRRNRIRVLAGDRIAVRRDRQQQAGTRHRSRLLQPNRESARQVDRSAVR